MAGGGRALLRGAAALQTQPLTQRDVGLLQRGVMAAEVEAGGAAVAANQVATLLTRVAAVPVVALTRPPVVRVLGALLLRRVRVLVWGLDQRPD